MLGKRRKVKSINPLTVVVIGLSIASAIVVTAKILSLIIAIL